MYLPGISHLPVAAVRGCMHLASLCISHASPTFSRQVYEKTAEILNQQFSAAITKLFKSVALDSANGLEYPRVAVARRKEFTKLVGLIHERCACTAGACPLTFHGRKAAGDILNKWIFFVVSDAAATRQNRPQLGGSNDPVLPSRTDITVQRWLWHQLKTMYDLPSQRLEGIVNELVQKSVEAAASLGRLGRDEVFKWRHRIDAGKELTDLNLGVFERRHPTDPESVQIVWRDPSQTANANAEEHVVELFIQHFERLKRAFAAAAAERAARPGGAEPPGRLLTRVFALVDRYDLLSEDKSANQSAVPQAMLEVMQRALGVHHECYASPLNHFFPSFCSAFPDSDGCFGSHGPFQSFLPTRGSFEANPPFDQRSVIGCFQHIGLLLAGADGPMSFVVVIPRWDDESESFKEAYQGCRPYERATAVAPAGRHSYMVGLQHRRQQGDKRYWEPEAPSKLYFLQNDEGAVRWPVTEHIKDELLASFFVLPEGHSHSQPPEGHSSLADLMNESQILDPSIELGELPPLSQ